VLPSYSRSDAGGGRGDSRVPLEIHQVSVADEVYAFAIVHYVVAGVVIRF
jgi:hypothetical protein